MEFFKIGTDYRYGPLIPDIKEAIWVERYDQPGEFTLIFSPASKAIMDFLPTGTLISHADSKDLMIVEEHEIEETPDDPEKPSTLTIRGRSLISFYENRITIPLSYHLWDDVNPLYTSWDPWYPVGGTNPIATQATGSPDREIDFYYAKDYPCEHAKKLLTDYIVGYPWSSAWEILSWAIYNDVTPGAGDTQEEARIERGEVLTEVLRQLNIADAGVKVQRPTTNADVTIDIRIHRGTDKTGTVQFKQGDFSSLKYLRSTVGYKNAVVAISKFVGSQSFPAGVSGMDFRVGLKMMDDINYNPTDAGNSFARMDRQKLVIDRRMKRYLRNHRRTRLVDVEIKNHAGYTYRTDYNIGDVVYVDGTYWQGTMRVIEYVEGFDENGRYGHPVLREKE